MIANQIKGIYAIINGTTNYILTRMSREGIDFASALSQAQKLGYAEAEPRKDIEGIDAAYKLAIREARTNATRLRVYTGMSELFVCPECKGEVLLAIIPDLSKAEKRWFSAYFVCSKCDRSF